ncbi:polysaccharide deacetylase family protein [Gilvimarinus chinensis]|uniref:polysaccharide deacetylase family protein n=1 Tax=Gilvimarinus chinensis TaxID=396005 RepID=UPI00037BB5C1|nr:polysaccharide deacetylase family protein [Gilvimarinus chinensis]
MLFRFVCLLMLAVVSSIAQAAVILQYHHISNDTPAATSTSPELFAEHIQFLADNDFTVLPLPELIKQLKNDEAENQYSAAITFDDGYDSVYRTAFPLLKERGYSFAIFVNSSLVGAPGYATWSELKEMQAAGAIIANHTATHPHMVRRKEGESEKQWRERMRTEIVTSEAAIKAHLKNMQPYLAYPYGEYSAALLSLVKELNYVGFAQHSGAVGASSDFLALPRFPMGSSYGRMETFPDKVNSMPFPLERVHLNDGRGQALDQPIVNADTKPQLTLELQSEAVAATVQCYWAGKPMKVVREGNRVLVQSEEGLTPGRSRYNCTAPASDGKRFYWFSQPWFITDKNGRWQHTD